MSATNRTYDLGLVIPTDGEFTDIRECLPLVPLPVDDGDYWYEFPIPCGRTGIARVLFDMGLTETATTATRMLQRFDPEVLVVLGIGGALSDELRLGDVVVGDTVQEYLKAAKASPDGAGHTMFRPAGSARPLPERLRRFVANFPYFNEGEHQQWVMSAKTRALDDGVPVATTPGSRREPACLLQPVASGDVVVSDAAFRDWLLSNDRKRGVIEMEGAGAAAAVNAYDKDVALLVVRGISDFADDRKAALDATVTERPGGVWRRYAVQNAAERLLTYLSSPGFPWRRPAQRSGKQWETLARPAQGGRGGVTSRAQATASRAWDYYNRVAHAVEVTGAAAGLLSAYRSKHHDGGRNTVDGQHPEPAPDPRDHDTTTTHHDQRFDHVDPQG